MQHTTHDGYGGTPDGSCIPQTASAPVGAARAEAAMLFHAARRALLNMVLGIFLRVIAQNPQTHNPDAANVPKTTLHIGAVGFIHLFGSCLNGHSRRPVYRTTGL